MANGEHATGGKPAASAPIEIQPSSPWSSASNKKPLALSPRGQLFSDRYAERIGSIDDAFDEDVLVSCAVLRRVIGTLNQAVCESSRGFKGSVSVDRAGTTLHTSDRRHRTYLRGPWTPPLPSSLPPLCTTTRSSRSMTWLLPPQSRMLGTRFPRRPTHLVRTWQHRRSVLTRARSACRSAATPPPPRRL